MSDENSFRSGRGPRGQLRRSLPILWGGTFTEEKTLAQIASEYEVHPTQLKNWQVEYPGRLAEKKGTTLSRQERVGLLERVEGELPLKMQADLLSLSRSSLYYQPRPPGAAEVQLKHRIDEIYTQWPFYGARKIAAQLQREGMVINRKILLDAVKNGRALAESALRKAS